MSDGTPIDLDKMRTIGVMPNRTRPTVESGVRPDGVRFKAVTDEHNNTVTERSGPGATGVSDGQDVLIRPKPIRLELVYRER